MVNYRVPCVIAAVRCANKHKSIFFYFRSSAIFFETTYHNNPGRFSSLKEAEQCFERFFNWYNKEQYYTGIGIVTPEDRHTGRDVLVLQERKRIKKNLEQRRNFHCNNNLRFDVARSIS